MIDVFAYILLFILLAVLIYGLVYFLKWIYNTLRGKNELNESLLPLDKDTPFNIKNPIHWFFSRVFYGLITPSFGILVIVIIIYTLITAITSN